MLWGVGIEPLELRRLPDGGVKLGGRFPYGKPAVLSDGGRNGGRPRKEVIAPRAFNYRIADPKEDIHLLVGHSYDRPLASRGAGTLDIRDSDEAVTFEATIIPQMQEVSWVKDLLAAIAAGLMVGLSPGFRLPPPRAVKEAERVEEEDPKLGTAIIRTVLAALLYELSVVTRPAYPESQVEMRNWQPSEGGVLMPKTRALNRWRV